MKMGMRSVRFAVVAVFCLLGLLLQTTLWALWLPTWMGSPHWVLLGVLYLCLQDRDHQTSSPTGAAWPVVLLGAMAGYLSDLLGSTVPGTQSCLTAVASLAIFGISKKLISNKWIVQAGIVFFVELSYQLCLRFLVAWVAEKPTGSMSWGSFVSCCLLTTLLVPCAMLITHWFSRKKHNRKRGAR